MSGGINEDELPLTDEEIIRQRTKRKNKNSDAEFKHCIVVIDVFSKYVELGALKSKSSTEV